MQISVTTGVKRFTRCVWYAGPCELNHLKLWFFCEIFGKFLIFQKLLWVYDYYSCIISVTNDIKSLHVGLHLVGPYVPNHLKLWFFCEIFGKFFDFPKIMSYELLFVHNLCDKLVLEAYTRGSINVPCVSHLKVWFFWEFFEKFWFSKKLWVHDYCLCTISATNCQKPLHGEPNMLWLWGLVWSLIWVLIIVNY